MIFKWTELIHPHKYEVLSFPQWDPEAQEIPFLSLEIKITIVGFCPVSALGKPRTAAARASLRGEVNHYKPDSLGAVWPGCLSWALLLSKHRMCTKPHRARSEGAFT